MNIFISHITEEASIAATLKKWIEATLIGMCDVFVSSDADSLTAGSRWLDEINRALGQADVMLVLCSKASVGRPWVNFETGCAWARAIPVMPVCHSNMAKDTLPRPLAEFQGLNADDPAFPKLLFLALRKHLKLAKEPLIDAASMSKELKEAIASVNSSSPSNKHPNTKAPTHNLPEEASEILGFLAQQQGDLSCEQLTQKFGWPHQRTQYFLDQLLEAMLVNNVIIMGEGFRYSISKDGRQLIFGSGTGVRAANATNRPLGWGTSSRPFDGCVNVHNPLVDDDMGLILKSHKFALNKLLSIGVS